MIDLVVTMKETNNHDSTHITISCLLALVIETFVERITLNTNKKEMPRITICIQHIITLTIDLFQILTML